MRTNWSFDVTACQTVDVEYLTFRTSLYISNPHHTFIVFRAISGVRRHPWIRKQAVQIVSRCCWPGRGCWEKDDNWLEPNFKEKKN